MYPAISTPLYSGSPYGNYTITRKHTQKVWFEARYRYWIPHLGDGTFPGQARAYAQVYGALPTPSLVWELTPWSWLIDWCSNLGDVIANVSSIIQDNLCAKYAYVMGHTEQEVTHSAVNNLVTGPITCEWKASLEAKLRHEASPFGFGLTGADFSARQWSILTALGISKMSKW
jgi:hypothetical protein